MMCQLWSLQLKVVNSDRSFKINIIQVTELTKISVRVTIQLNYQKNN